jgi:UDP:flavonoid glycosyltransferase YjiC (YdhE family)
MAVIKWAPQMALLHNAAVMVTHGGLNSVMECIHLGVPMVVVPGLRDQPGNMVRAVSHGVAVGASMKGLQAHQLAAKVAYAMGSEEMRRALAKLRDSIATENGLLAALELLESLAGKP